MKNNKLYRHFTFDIFGKGLPQTEMNRRHKEYTDLVDLVVEKFSPLKKQEILQFTHWHGDFSIIGPVVKYKKEYLIQYNEIAQDILAEHLGLVFGTQWDNYYISIPRTQIEILELIDANPPSFMREISKQP